MLAQYLVSLGATNLLKVKEKNVKAVNSPQVKKERKFRVNLLVESFCIVFQKYIFRTRLQAQLCCHFSTKFQARVLIKLFL